MGPELFISQAFDDFFAVSVCVYFYSIFVQRQQTTVSHKYTTINDHIPDIIGFCGVNEIGIVVIGRHLVYVVTTFMNITFPPEQPGSDALAAHRAT